MFKTIKVRKQLLCNKNAENLNLKLSKLKFMCSINELLSIHANCIKLKVT